MRVRLIFYCPRCGSLLFRASTSRAMKDTVLGSLGVHPHRCYMCRLRFYLFKPIRLKGFLAAFDHPLVGVRRPEPDPLDSPAQAQGRAVAAGAGELLRHNRL
jgi:hypothetical protein